MELSVAYKFLQANLHLVFTVLVNKLPYGK